MSGSRRVVAAFALGWLATGCRPDCDYELEVEAILAADTVDCGSWRKGDDPEPIGCAMAAIAEGRDFLLHTDFDSVHSTHFSYGNHLYQAFSFEDAPWALRIKTQPGVSVDRCEGSLDEALAALENEGYCSKSSGGRSCNVCPYDESCVSD